MSPLFRCREIRRMPFRYYAENVFRSNGLVNTSSWLLNQGIRFCRLNSESAFVYGENCGVAFLDGFPSNGKALSTPTNFHKQTGFRVFIVRCTTGAGGGARSFVPRSFVPRDGIFPCRDLSVTTRHISWREKMLAPQRWRPIRRKSRRRWSTTGWRTSSTRA